MKFIWKGRIKDIKELPKGELPAHAVKYKEPNDFKELTLRISLFMIPAVLLIGLAVFLRSRLYPGFSFPSFKNYAVGFLLAFLMILPHEFLHAIVYPKDAEVLCYYKPEQLLALVYSTYPMSKSRFIFSSLLPNIVFGIFPLTLWVVLPLNQSISEILISFSSSSLLFGCGDYMNVYNTIMQVPNGAMTQLSGFNSYWYLDDEPKKRATN